MEGASVNISAEVHAQKDAAKGRAAAESTTVPPWYQVNRRIALGLPWKAYTSITKWYVDRSGPRLATPAPFSVPILVWRLLMLIWALWLVSRLLNWIPWGWRAFSSGGIWRPRSPSPDAPPGPGAPAGPADPSTQSAAPQPGDTEVVSGEDGQVASGEDDKE